MPKSMTMSSKMPIFESDLPFIPKYYSDYANT